jgi:exosortase
MILGQKRNNSVPLFMIGVVLAALVFLYLPFLRTLVAAWGTNDDYSHGYFIPFLAIFMIYSQREKLADTPVRPGSSGLVLIVAALLLLIAAKVGSELFSQRLSLIFVLLGLVHFLFGWRHLQLVLLPILYLLFMIPLPAIIWNTIAFPLQLFSSALTEKAIYLIGIPVFREGNILHLSETTLEVVAACSGLRSLVTMFALAGAFAFLSSLTPWRKWLLFFSAAPIAILANIIRLTLTAVLASRYGSEVAHGFLHDFSGLVVFAVGLLLLIAVSRLLAVSGRQ